MGIFQRNKEDAKRNGQGGSGPRALSSVNFSSDDSIVEFVEGRWKNRAQHRQALERQWAINIAQYLGLQYHNFDNWTRELVQPRTPPGVVRLVCNKLMPGVRKAVAKFLRQKPTWTAIPATNDREDQIKAELGTKVLRAYHRTLKMDRKYVSFATWLFTTGNCFIRAVWDPSASYEITFDEDEIIGMGDDAGELVKGGLNIGDVQVNVRGPYGIDVDPGAEVMEDAGWLIDSSAVWIERLHDRYGPKAKQIEPDAKSTDSLTSYYLKKIQDFGGALAGLSGGGDDDEAEDTSMVHELWAAPTKSMKHGYHCVVAGGKVLQKTDRLPSDFRRIPYGHAFQIMVPGRLWGQAALEHAIPLQASYNKGRSQMIKARNDACKPKILEPGGSKISDQAFTDVSGERIKYTYPFAPSWMELKPLPDYVHRILDYDMRDIEDVLGVHEVTNSRAPSGVRAGVAINALQEQDDQTLAPTFLVVEEVFSDIGSWILQLVAKNVTEERGVRIVGEEHEVDWITFIGEDLIGPNAKRPGVSYFDVECQMGSQLPLSKSQKTQYVIDLINAQVFDPIADKKRIKQMLELGSEEPGIKADQLDRQNARREQRMILEGIYVEPEPSDDHDIHFFEEHTTWMKTPEYRRAVEADPSVRERMEAHMAATEAMMQGVLPEAPEPGMEGEEGEPGMEPGVEGGVNPEEIALMLSGG